MIDRVEILVSRLRRLVSHSRWSARLMGFPSPPSRDDEPGLVLIQIDGLGEDVLRAQLSRMPFVLHLLEDEGYRLHSLYSGVPSNTPGFQAEFFFGVRTAVPAFGYFDRELARVVSLNDPVVAAALEKRLRQRNPGLLQRGSAWSNLFGADAAEPHFCASTAGLDSLLRALNPLRVLGLLLWHGVSVLRVAFHLGLETVVALWDVVAGTIAGRDLGAELRFIPARIAVSAGLREIVTAGACADAERGLPVIHANFLGYDEHAHRRGPDSRFAAWTLKGIDRCVRRIWMAAHRSQARDYQVWIYSDHGQEATQPYVRPGGRALRDVVARLVAELSAGADTVPKAPARMPPMRTDLAVRRWMREDLPDWMTPLDPPTPPVAPTRAATDRPEQLQVVHQGPLGHVYLPEAAAPDYLSRLATAICERGEVPFVLWPDQDGGALVAAQDGIPRRLPDDAPDVFGQDHPYLTEVTRDVLAVCHHPEAGDLTLLGYHPEHPTSLQHENGAHGGPGARECSAFVALPPETDATGMPGPLRPTDLRDLAVAVRQGDIRGRPATATARTFRLMTYNVHGCRGMDGRISPQRIARVIARARPDVVCLQELDFRRGRSDDVDQARVIAQLLQKDVHFHAVAEFHDGQFGNAILSSRPLSLVDQGPLPHLTTIPALERRGVLWVEIELDGLVVQILNTHLSILPQERRVQVDALLGPRWLSNPACGGPVVVCGDLNASPDSYTVRRLKTQLGHVNVDPAGLAPTWSSRLPLRRIDHVFATPHFDVTAVSTLRNRLTKVASDHLPLVVDLTPASESD